MALLLTFFMMLVLSGIAVGVGTFAHNSQLVGKTQLLDAQAAYVAEAGWQYARQALADGTWTAATTPGNTYTADFPASPATKVGEYSVTIVDNGDSTYTITSSGYVPTASVYAARRQMVETSLSVTTADGTNYSLTATASASSTNGSNIASNAKDGSTSTRWEAGTAGSGQWLAMDHSSAVALDKIVVEEHSNIDGVNIQWSDDGSSWTTVSGLSVTESPSKTWTATFTETTHRHFRAVFTASGGSKKVAVKEQQHYNASGLTLGAGTYSDTW